MGRKNMRDFYKQYLNTNLKFDKKTWVGIAAAVIAITGCFGWLYEFIFYFFNGGMKEFYWRGGNFLPWINIYATGSVMIFLLTYRVRKKPLFVFLISFFSTGILEYISGWGMLKFAGLRCWDYNKEILNWGNLNGFVCLRSVTIFGIFGLTLMYVIIPILFYLASHMNKKVFLAIAITVCAIILCDEFYNLIFTKLFNLPGAPTIYAELGLKFVEFN